MSLVKKMIRPGTKVELQPEAMNDITEMEEGVMLNPDDDGWDDADEEDTRSGNAGAEQKYYSSKVSDVGDDNTVEIYMPSERGKLIFLSVGSNVNMYCFTAKGIYECRAVVKDRYTNEGLYLLLLEVIGDLKRNQRREYYRFKCSVEMQDRFMDAMEQRYMTDYSRLDVDEDVPMETSMMLDISGGGIRFTGKHKYEVDDLVYCKFTFGKKYAQCVRILESKKVSERSDDYCNRAKFVGITNRQREEIIKNIFMLERTRN